MKQTIKVTITGAAGQIGYALLFRIAAGEMFGKNAQVEFNLLELPGAIEALKGVEMELKDCAFPLLTKISCTSNPLDAFKDIDWALLVGSVPRKAGMARKDLLNINAGVFIEQGKALSEAAKPTCKVLVVGNPCNTNAYIAKTVAKNIPDENFFALTMLDQNRAYAQIADKLNDPEAKISNLIVWGNHSATQYPNFYNADISGKPLTERLTDTNWLETDFLKIVQQRGAEIIRARGVSSAASAANAVIDTVKNLTHKTEEDTSFSVAVSSDGSYGIDEGIMFSFPVRSDGTSWKIVQGIELNEFSKQKILMSLEELRQEKTAIEKLL